MTRMKRVWQFGDDLMTFIAMGVDREAVRSSDASATQPAAQGKAMSLSGRLEQR